MAEETDFERTLRTSLSDADLQDGETASRFSRLVVARLARRRQLRAVALTTAGGVGLAISAVGLGGVIRQLAVEQLPALAGQLASVGPSLPWLLPLAAALVVLVSELPRSPTRL